MTQISFRGYRDKLHELIEFIIKSFLTFEIDEHIFCHEKEDVAYHFSRQLIPLY